MTFGVDLLRCQCVESLVYRISGESEKRVQLFNRNVLKMLAQYQAALTAQINYDATTGTSVLTVDVRPPLDRDAINTMISAHIRQFFEA